MEPHVPDCKGQQVRPDLIYPVLYNGPVHYFARLVKESGIVLEAHDNYTKQTYRNRCLIPGANGVLTLTIPVKRMKGVKCLFRDVRVDYSQPWNRIHWKSFEAAYSVSPYFEYIRDELEPFYRENFDFLIDLNHKLLEKVLEILGLHIPIRFSESFSELQGPGDPRTFMHLKKGAMEADPYFRILPYHQVFMERHGFQPNLSILDLLFNMGPESLSILTRSIRT